MSTTTYLELFKHDDPANNTSEFDVDKSLNENWDKIDENAREVSDNIDEIIDKVKEHIEEISNIKAKNTEQDKYISELEAENSRLREDLNGLPKVQVSGESIDLSDSAEMRCELKISGNSKQETSVQGKNMLDVAIFDESTDNGITLTKTKGTNKVTLNGTTTTNFTIHSNDLDISQFEVGKTYTLSISTDKCKYSFEVFENDSSSASIWSNSITMQSTYTRIRTYLQRNSAVTFDNEEIALQFEAGEATEIEDFTPDMPSPDYPSEVESCGDNINLFDKDNANKIQDTFIGITGSVGTATANQIVYVECKKNATITVQKKVSTRFRVATYSSTDIVGKTLSNVKVNDAGTSITITSGEKDTYLFVQYIGPDDKDNSATILKTLKIAYSSKETGYSEYGQGSINEVICNKNLLDKNLLVLNKWINGDNGTIMTTTSGNYYATEKYIPFNQYVGKTITSAETMAIAFYDSNKTFISINKSTNPRQVVVPSKTEYIRVEVRKDYYEVAQLELGSTATPYEEHKSQTYTIPTQQPFRAIGDIRDTFIKKNNKWYERHYIPRNIFDGTETFKYVSSSNIIYTDIFTDRLLGKDNLISSHFKVVNNRSYETMELNTITGDNANKNRIIFKTEYTNAEDFKAWLTSQYNAGTPVYVDYISENPTDIECTEEQSIILDQIENEAKTYKNITHIYSTDEISPNVDVTYKQDLETRLNNIEQAILSQGGNI